MEGEKGGDRDGTGERDGDGDEEEEGNDNEARGINEGASKGEGEEGGVSEQDSSPGNPSTNSFDRHKIHLLSPMNHKKGEEKICQYCGKMRLSKNLDLEKETNLYC